MPITYCGIPLTPPSDADAVVGRYWHKDQISEFEHQSYFTQVLQHLPTPYPPQRESPRIGVLRWPSGADRFSTCHLIAIGSQLEALRTAMGGTPAAQTLVITDGMGGEIETEMFLLPPRPISQGKTGGEELYLLTLVDERWFWFQAGAIESPTTTSWSSLLSSLFTAIGVTPTIASVPSAYLTPNEVRWGLTAYPPSVAIAAACRQINLNVTRDLNGTVIVWDYAGAAADDEARWGTISSLVYAGGQIDGGDLGRSAPASLDVQFFDGAIQNVPLAGLAIVAYDGIAGVADKKGLFVADPAEPSNAQKTAYSTQAAADWYNWYLSPTDCTLRGIVDVAITALDDVVEWVHHPAGIVTRIIRPQWSDRNVYGVSLAETCTGHEWVAGLATEDCLTLDFPSGAGRCGCAPLPSSVTLTSSDGTTWDADQSGHPASVTICDVDYIASFDKGDCNGPCLTLTQAGCCAETVADDLAVSVVVSGGDTYWGTLRRASGGWQNGVIKTTEVARFITAGDEVFVPDTDGDYDVWLHGAGADNTDGAGGLGSGGSGGGAFARKVVALIGGNTYHIHIPSGDPLTGDATFETTQVVAKSGSPSSGSIGGAGGSAASSVGTIKYSGGAGANASGSTGGGGGGAAGISGNGYAAVGATGGFGIPGPSPAGGGNGGTGGSPGNAGTNGAFAGGGAGGQGVGSLSATTGGVGNAYIFASYPTDSDSPSAFVRLYCVGGQWYAFVRLPDVTEVTVGPLTDTDGTLSGTSGDVTVTIASPCPGASPSPIGPFTGTRGCGGCNYSNFSFGDPTLCTDDPAEGGPCKNLLHATVSWTCCPIDGWQGAGWYCITATEIEDDSPSPAELLESDKCDSSITIVSGPYGTEAEAQAACPGAIPPVYNVTCGIYSDLPDRVQVVISSQCPEFLVDHPSGSLTVYAGPSTDPEALWQLPPNIGRDIGDPGGWFIGGNIRCNSDASAGPCGGPFVFFGAFQGCSSNVSFHCDTFLNQTGSGTTSPVNATIQLYPVPGPTGFFTLTITDYGPGP